MLQIKRQRLVRRFSVGRIHHADDALIGEAFHGPAVFDQHIWIGGRPAVGSLCHKCHVGDENLSRIYLLQDGFNNGRLAGDALRIAIDLEIAMGFVHRPVAN